MGTFDKLFSFISKIKTELLLSNGIFSEKILKLRFLQIFLVNKMKEKVCANVHMCLNVLFIILRNVRSVIEYKEIIFNHDFSVCLFLPRNINNIGKKLIRCQHIVFLNKKLIRF